MKKVIGIAVLCCMVGLLVAPTSAKEVAVKAGGALYFGDDVSYGGAVAVDVPTPLLEGRIFISPFVDLYPYGGPSKSNVKIGVGGVSALYKAPAGEGLQVYAGLGGGAGQVRFQNKKETGGMLALMAGLQYAATEKISVFAQGKFLAIMTDDITVGTVAGNRDTMDAPRKFTVQAGVAFNVGQ